MIQLSTASESRGHRAISRTDDRRITFAGLVLAVGLLGLAVLSLLLPEAVRRGTWLSLHLALAGAASTAIASVLPFFTAALAVAPPAGRPTRILAIGGIAGGALVVSGGVAAGALTVAVGGGLAYLGGLAAVAAAAFGPLRGALGQRRPLITRAYAVAIACVGVGVMLSTLMLAGFAPVVERWALLKPAHAWLNVVGFISLVVAATLVHLAPTVAGGRIVPRRSARVAIAGLGIGSPVLAVGLALADPSITRLGALVTIGGSLSLVVHGFVVQRDRGRWTTDPSWHRLTSWSLLLAPIWLAVALAIAGGRYVALGADPAAWDVAVITPALVLGWVVQVMIGSWSHLLPAIGPGDPHSHARQRTVLGTVATIRLAAFNGGIALATVGVATGVDWATMVGIALAITPAVGALILFGWAARLGATASPTARA